MAAGSKLSPHSGIVTVRLPRAVEQAEKAGYCGPEVLAPLEEAGAKGELSHHVFSHVNGNGAFEIFTDPGNACQLSTAEKTGTSLWYAATVFIEHLLSSASNLFAPGCRVCEVGSGCGAVGLALHFALGCRAVLTDQEQMMPLLYLNAAHNAHRLKGAPMPTVTSLSWGDDAAAAAVLDQSPGGRFDLIIGSDVTYEPGNHDILLSTLAALANGRADGDVSGAAAEGSVEPARVLLAAPDWLQPGQATSSSLRDGFLDRSAVLGWRWEVLSTTHSRGNGSGWLNAAGGASKSNACPVVLLMGKPPPPPQLRRRRMSFL